MNDLLSHITTCLPCLVGLYIRLGYGQSVEEGGKDAAMEFLIEGAPALATLVSNIDQRLFNSISANICHLLQRQLTDVKNTEYNIRPRAYEYMLPV